MTMYKLLQAYEKVIKKFNERMYKPQHVVVKYNYSLEGQRTYLIDHLKEKKRIPFETLFDTCENRIHAIFTFLAMLELIQQNFLGILVGMGRNNFILEWSPVGQDAEDAALLAEGGQPAEPTDVAEQNDVENTDEEPLAQ